MKGRTKQNKKDDYCFFFFYSSCNYYMTRTVGHISHFDSTLQSYLLSLCHCLWACMKTTLLLQSNLARLIVVHLFSPIYLGRADVRRLALKKDGLVAHSDQQESVRGISEPRGVFNMEIGFEPHLHRSAHLWAKLCYC